MDNTLLNFLKHVAKYPQKLILYRVKYTAVGAINTNSFVLLYCTNHCDVMTDVDYGIKIRTIEEL